MQTASACPSRAGNGGEGPAWPEPRVSMKTGLVSLAVSRKDCDKSHPEAALAVSEEKEAIVLVPSRRSSPGWAQDICAGFAPSTLPLRTPTREPAHPPEGASWHGGENIRWQRLPFPWGPKRFACFRITNSLQTI